MTALVDILFYFNLLYYWSNWTEYLSCICYICSTPSKTHDCKIQITDKENFSLRYFINIFLINWQCFQHQYRLPNIVVTWAKLLGPPFLIQITQFCSNLGKVVGQTSQTPILFLKEVGWKFWVWLLKKNVGDRFNEGMSFITHFIFLQVILSRLQMLLTFSRHQMMYNVSYVVLCAEVNCKGYFLIQ